MGDNGRVPFGQRFYNNLLLIFVLGFLFMLGSYTIWGLVEIIIQPTLP